MKQTITLFIIYLIMGTTMQAQEKLIYVGDPMCSWCYGFAPELESLIENNNDAMDIELVVGGLRPYHKTPINEMKGFLAEHWAEVNKATNQPFQYDILDREDLAYDTEPPCRAVVVVRSMNSDVVFDFFKLVQEAFYHQNIALNVVENYYPILNKLGLNKKVFTERFESDEYKALVKQDFERANALGVQGFPSVLYASEAGITILSRGYKTAKDLQQMLFEVRGKE